MVRHRWTWLAIALSALVAVSCTGPATSTGPPSTPTRPDAASVSDRGEAPSAVVAKRDFRIAYQLEGQTAASPGLPLNPPTGMVWRPHSAAGATVEVDDNVGQLEVDTAFRSALQISAKTSRIDAARLAKLPDRPRDVTAPVAGKVQVSDSGDVTIAAPGIDVVVPITGIQQLRLSSIPIQGAATVETTVGQRTIDCATLWIDPQLSQSAETAKNAAASLRCRLPSIVETAPMLRATLHVTSKVINNATVVPDVMFGQNATGYTVTIMKDGEKVTIPVDVGPSNGVVRVVTTKLPIGAKIVDPNR